MHLTPLRRSPRYQEEHAPLEKQAAQSLWATVASFLSTFFALIVSLLGLATTLSFQSIIESISVRSRYFWFAVAIFVFQIILVIIVLELKKRNAHIIELQQRLIGVYLTKLENSFLNPTYQSSKEPR